MMDYLSKFAHNVYIFSLFFCATTHILIEFIDSFLNTSFGKEFFLEKLRILAILPMSHGNFKCFIFTYKSSKRRTILKIKTQKQIYVCENIIQIMIVYRKVISR